MITYKKMDATCFPQYDQIPMKICVSAYYRIEKLNRGLGGFTLVETPVTPYIKDFCTEKKWPPGEFNLPKALNTGKAFLENEASWSFSSTFKEPVSLSGDFAIAMRVGARHQIEAAIPFEVKQVEETRSDGSTSRRWGEGVGDIAAAWKSALWFTRRGGNIGSLTLDVFFPTGDEADDMGSGIFVLEPAFAFAQIIPYVGFLQLQVGAELSTNIDTQNHVVFWRGAFGRSFRKGGFGRTVSPMVEVLGEKEIADGTIISWDVVPELQIALSKRQHVRFGAGLVIPVTEFQDRQLTLMAYLLWDWYDGGFFEGWK